LDEILLNSSSAPVIYTDSTQKNVLHHANLEKGFLGSNPNESDKVSERFLQDELNSMKEENQPIKVELRDGTFNYIFYKKSLLLQQLKYFPAIQLGIIALFVLVSYLLFSSSRKAEQNQVWVGMSKETAHQLGTPISSLLAWLEILKIKNEDDPVLDEIKRDINRLEVITERFSKIGSDPELTVQDLETTISESISYLKKRVSKKVEINLENHAQNANVKISLPLFGWVIENLTKNAVDAMDGVGKLDFLIQEQQGKIYLDVSDTGKGIPKNKFQSIFKPGYTTKKRGWGLGLTLVKRIIENYHRGSIFVKQSAVGKGTTFRVILEKS
jgi:signal transduction histidine kinase